MGPGVECGKIPILSIYMQKLFAFLKDYWVIAIIFLLMGWLLGCNLPTIGIFILNLLGFEVGVQEVMGYDYVNVVFAWYVRFYLLVLFVRSLYA